MHGSVTQIGLSAMSSLAPMQSFSLWGVLFHVHACSHTWSTFDQNRDPLIHSTRGGKIPKATFNNLNILNIFLFCSLLHINQRWNSSLSICVAAPCHFLVIVNLIGLLHLFLLDDSSSYKHNVTLLYSTHIWNHLLPPLRISWCVSFSLLCPLWLSS